MPEDLLGTAKAEGHHGTGPIVLLGLILANAGRYYGLGKIWQRVGFVRDRRYLY